MRVKADMKLGKKVLKEINGKDETLDRKLVIKTKKAKQEKGE